jgi:hypothetical protein
MQNFKLTPINAAITASIALTLAACGGGSSNTESKPPELTTVKGSVYINQAVQNAVVCMDLNANNACDAGEPTSSKTGTDGAYSLTYDPSLVSASQVAGAPLVANISTSAIDAGSPGAPVTTTSYVLSAPAAQAAQINPLTTLVQTGIASGLTKAASEAAVALQLEVPVADIYNYQANAALNSAVVADNARNMAQVVVAALAAGVKLSVINPASTATAAASDQLIALTYTDSNNYLIRNRPTDNKANTSNGKVSATDSRTGKTNGATTPHDTLYPTVYLTPNGWVRCDETLAITSTLGAPNRSSSCAGNNLSVSYSSNIDISGQKMADVVTQIQAEMGVNTSITLLPSVLGAAVFPADSSLRKSTNMSLEQNIFINNTATDGGVAGATTLEQVVANRPTSKVNLNTGGGTVGLGLVDDTHALRVAFKDTVNAVQYYRCDFVQSTNTISACVATTTGTFAISTVNGVRTMAFAAQPSTPATTVRGLAEYSGSVFTTRQSKPDSKGGTSTSQRLNGTAWTAMKAVLGL